MAAARSWRQSATAVLHTPIRLPVGRWVRGAATAVRRRGVSVLVGAAVATAVTATTWGPWAPPPPLPPTVSIATLTGDPRPVAVTVDGTVEGAAARAAGAVVAITSGESSGSGFFIAADTILTGWHVVARDGQTVPFDVEVTLDDGRERSGRVTFTDEQIDLAIVTLPDPVEGIRPLRFADAATITVGQQIVVLGAPAGLERTVTTGVVSSVARNDPRIRLTDAQVNLVQTDAAVNPGNSGGPMVNLDGDVGGMVLLRPEVDQYDRRLDGVSLATRSDMLVAALQQVADHGDLQLGWLGVQTRSATPDDRIDQGAVVVGFDDHAAVTDLSVGDVVVAVDDHPVRSAEDLLSAIGMLRPGAVVQLGVWRDGALLSVAAELTSRPTVD